MGCSACAKNAAARRTTKFESFRKERKVIPPKPKVSAPLVQPKAPIPVQPQPVPTVTPTTVPTPPMVIKPRLIQVPKKQVPNIRKIIPAPQPQSQPQPTPATLISAPLPVTVHTIPTQTDNKRLMKKAAEKAKAKKLKALKKAKKTKKKGKR